MGLSMDHLKFRQRPEQKIQDDLIKKLEEQGWCVRELHGTYQNDGWPDLCAWHPVFGQRWIEVKLPEMKGSKFTTAQLHWFPIMINHGMKLWIITSVDELPLLHKPPNAMRYLVAKTQRY